MLEIEFHVVLFRQVCLAGDLAREAGLIIVRGRRESFDVILRGLA